MKVTIQTPYNISFTTYNISFTTFNIQLKFIRRAKQKNMTHDLEKKAVNRNQYQDEPDVGISTYGLQSSYYKYIYEYKGR